MHSAPLIAEPEPAIAGESLPDVTASFAARRRLRERRGKLLKQAVYDLVPRHPIIAELAYSQGEDEGESLFRRRPGMGAAGARAHGADFAGAGEGSAQNGVADRRAGCGIGAALPRKS